MQKEDEIEIVNKRNVKWNGVKGILGHPLIYLTISNDNDQVVCPYCSKIFQYQEK